MGVKLTEQEKNAATQDGDNPSNPAEVIAIEEMALLYVNSLDSGDTPDPRAQALVDAAKAAGRINANNEWVDAEADAAIDG